MDKLIAEAIGTYFLYLLIGMCVIEPGAGQLAPVAIGFGLVALVCAMGHICKAHYNPAVTVAAVVAGRHPKEQAVTFIGSQLVAVVLAGLTVALLKPELPSAAGPEMGPALLAEALFTFMLVWVILNVAAAKALEGNQFYGLAIGTTVLAGAYAVGPVSGAAFNPAVTVGLCMNGLLPWSFLPAYVAVQIVAGVAAALLFRAIVPAAD